MLVLKANKKLVQDKLATSTGKAILLKDLSNINSRMKKGDTRNDLNKCSIVFSPSIISDFVLCMYM